MLRIRKPLLVALISLAVALATLAFVAWWSLFRDVEPDPIEDDVRWFKYGSLGGEAELGIPYWIWIVLPRMFPDLLPGPGGYQSFGLAWENGQELPVGFTKRTVGFARVGNNCALCHVATYRLSAEESPRLAVGAPAHTFDTQGMVSFLTNAAADARFNSAAVLREIDQVYDLGVFERALYRFLLIPFTRKALLEQRERIAWAHRPNRSAWGPGRDDSFNLPKFMLAGMAIDDTHGPSDFGSTWNLSKRRGPGLNLNWTGESPDVRTVLVDSSVGLGARPGDRFEADMARLDRFLGGLAPPKWPYADGPHAVDVDAAARGRSIFERACAECHEPGRPRCNKVIPIGEVGTEPERLAVWTQAAADATNRVINEDLGARRPDLVKNDGYLASPLDGAWIRAPYLHNGSVPSLRALLQPPAERPAVFHRGYDVYDPVDVGFQSRGPEAERRGRKHDVRERGNSNAGHLYGTELDEKEKEALLQYMKTL